MALGSLFVVTFKLYDSDENGVLDNKVRFIFTTDRAVYIIFSSSISLLCVHWNGAGCHIFEGVFLLTC